MAGMTAAVRKPARRAWWNSPCRPLAERRHGLPGPRSTARWRRSHGTASFARPASAPPRNPTASPAPPRPAGFRRGAGSAGAAWHERARQSWPCHSFRRRPPARRGRSRTASPTHGPADPRPQVAGSGADPARFGPGPRPAQGHRARSPARQRPGPAPPSGKGPADAKDASVAAPRPPSPTTRPRLSPRLRPRRQPSWPEAANRLSRRPEARFPIRSGSRRSAG